MAEDRVAITHVGTTNRVTCVHDYSVEEFEAIKSLMVEIGLPTLEDLFNNAITLLRWVATEKKAVPHCYIASVSGAGEVIEDYKGPL
jgi:hypothetical protein